MFGQMMYKPLLISELVAHAGRYHGDTRITSMSTDGGTEQTNWAEIERNARRLGSALHGLGLGPQARCATIAWNNRRHLEIYFGTSGAGFVCHTINPRLFPEQLIYIINHAEDEVLFIDRTFVPLVASIHDKLEHVKHIVLMEETLDDAAASLPNTMAYDDLLAQGDAGYVWPVLDELTASSLCYTSGTTGNPKGVLYSHRSTVLHAMAESFCGLRGTICARCGDAGGADVSCECLGYSLCLRYVRLQHGFTGAASGWGVAGAAD